MEHAKIRLLMIVGFYGRLDYHKLFPRPPEAEYTLMTCSELVTAALVLSVLMFSQFFFDQQPVEVI